MPHVSQSGGDELGPNDEVKVYQDEGEEEQRSSENLSEDKLGLVTESEEGKTSDGTGENYNAEGKPGSTDGKSSDAGPDRLAPYPFNLLPSPYPLLNGASVPAFGAQHPWLFMYNNHDRYATPPPAHQGIPPVQIDPKTGLPRSVYPLHGHPPGQFNPYFPDGFNWAGGGYPVTSSALGGRYPPLTASPLSRFSPPAFLHSHPGLPAGFSHPALITPGPKQEIHPDHNHRGPPPGMEHHQNGHAHQHQLDYEAHQMQMQKQQQAEKRKHPYVKKPLNAFMLFMREQRQKVIEECTLKESAAINQILGKKWHALDRSEQAKYYEMARKEKELHQQLYPGWSARDNYASHNKKKKRKREPGQPASPGSSLGNNDSASYEAKKCRARFGLDAQNQWCKPCRRKKKCIRALGLDENDVTDSEDDGSQGPTTDGENHSMPGGSPMPDSILSSMYGSPVTPRSPLVNRPMLSPLVPPTTPPSTAPYSHHSPSASRLLQLPSTPSSLNGGASSLNRGAGQYLSPHHPLFQHQQAQQQQQNSETARRLLLPGPSSKAPAPASSSTAATASSTSSSLPLATL